VRAAIQLFLGLLLLVGVSPARADELRPGYLELTQQSASEWKLIWKAPILGGLATRAEPLLPDFCQLKLETSQLVGPAVVAKGQVTCSKSLDGATVGLRGMEPGSTDALLRVAPLNRPVQSERLTPGNSAYVVSGVPDRWQVARTYFVIGVEHIVGGFDHLLFVVALVLLTMCSTQITK